VFAFSGSVPILAGLLILVPLTLWANATIEESRIGYRAALLQAFRSTDGWVMQRILSDPGSDIQAALQLTLGSADGRAVLLLMAFRTGMADAA